LAALRLWQDGVDLLDQRIVFDAELDRRPAQDAAQHQANRRHDQNCAEHYRINPAKPMNARLINPAVIMAMLTPWNGFGYVGSLQPLTHRGEQHQHQRETERTAQAIEQRFEKIVLLLHIQQGNAQHGAVGGDQGQVDAQHAEQHRRGLLDEHLGETDDAGDHHDEGQGAQIRQILAEQIGIDQITGAGSQCQHEGGRGTHADGGFQLARNPHERA
jgi:hypothetical protein